MEKTPDKPISKEKKKTKVHTIKDEEGPQNSTTPINLPNIEEILVVYEV